MDTLITFILWGVAIIVGFKLLALAAYLVIVGAAVALNLWVD